MPRYVFRMGDVAPEIYLSKTGDSQMPIPGDRGEAGAC